MQKKMILIPLQFIHVSLSCTFSLRLSPSHQGWRDTRKPCEERRNEIVFKRNETSFLLKRRPFLMTVAANHSWIISTICVISRYMYCIGVKGEGVGGGDDSCQARDQFNQQTYFSERWGILLLCLWWLKPHTLLCPFKEVLGVSSHVWVDKTRHFEAKYLTQSVFCA